MLSYTIVEPTCWPLLLRLVQATSLLSFAGLTASLGRGGLIFEHCVQHSWVSPVLYKVHHCPSSVLQFTAGMLHCFFTVAVLLEITTSLPVIRVRA